jgi:hypothetical protein
MARKSYSSCLREKVIRNIIDKLNREVLICDYTGKEVVE